MLTIKCPSTYKPEREYICHVLLGEFLGLEYRLQYGDCPDWCICDDNGSCLILPDILFQTPGEQWLSAESLPRQPLEQWDVDRSGLDCNLVGKKIPVIYGNLNCQPHKISAQPSHQGKLLTLPIDIFGSAFFMLSRYEEVVKPDRDEHDRFPASASLALQEEFLDRPVVNEYLEILWAGMKKLWPTLERKKRTFRMRVTCDVDHPCQEGLRNPLRQIKTIGADLIRRKNPGLALKSSLNYIFSRFGNFSFDPYLSAIYWIMDENEKASNRVAFYFKAGHTDPQFDSRYSLNEPVIRKLLRDIHDRDHGIGLHPSYRTYLDGKQLHIEADNLSCVLAQEGIKQDMLGSRQHYLRWDSAKTPAILEQAGINYDTTLSYADHVGFRCGVCYEYPLYDFARRQQLKLVEKSLIVMECSLLSSKYMGVGKNTQTAITYMSTLKDRCELFNGDYILLWHNNLLTNPHIRKLYRYSI